MSKQPQRHARPLYSKGRWMIERERCQIPADVPPPMDADPIALDDGLKVVLGALGGEAATWLSRIQAAWPRVAGQQVASHTRPGRLYESVLTVFVDSSVWLNELSRFGQKRLVANLLESLPECGVTALRFQLEPDSPGRR